MSVIYWHNSRCSKSRAGLEFLAERGAHVTERRYLDDAPDVAEIRAVLAKLGLPAIEMMRRGERVFKALGLGRDSAEDALIAAMAAHPILIERPIAIKGARAVIGRPTEALGALL
ncbi:arsenate reductase (glutaredoxin) [Litorivita sp. NS0012-18]|uniref:arsenate reductase (glutaredoxin) n=1 Tax=Litorivita sp. NS0012-18 TaxID=3127655 RepID=UPI00310A1068